MILSQQSDQILPALFKARGKFVKAKKDKQNTHLKNKYATLDSMMEAVTPALTDNGIMIMQSMLDTSTDTTFHLETMLIHAESGQFARFFMSMPIAKRDPQGVGSAMTYARRYGLAAALGISQADDDAQLAVKSAADWKKDLDECEDFEQLKDVWATAFRQCDAANKAIVQDHYNKLKAKFEVGKARGFRPAEKPEQKKPVEPEQRQAVQSQSINDFE
ncbi:putative recombination protein [Escherichia phage SRT8]|uniref:Putative recombination protein n=1 Tax=Escherichia phage SRT8 TaxID=2496545 RepID=A0A2D1GNY9_9CAUD|nr:Erf-like ssDNA annealing protein [Escherichia phage SRT8]ATN93782.1 putative recombination protein [Escherichia phage SRT8]